MSTFYTVKKVLLSQETVLIFGQRYQGLITICLVYRMYLGIPNDVSWYTKSLHDMWGQCKVQILLLR